MAHESRFCPACGSANEPHSNFCRECGAVLVAPPQQPYPTPPPAPYGPPLAYPGPPAYPGMQRSAGLCVAALIAGILAWLIPFVGPLLAVLAIVLGALGIREVNRRPQELSGRGMGIAGLVLGITGLAVSVLIIVLLVGGFHSAQTEADLKTCQSNMRTILGASHTYMADNDVYPSSIGQMVPEYLKREPTCPSGGTYRISGGGSLPLEVSCSKHGSI